MPRRVVVFASVLLGLSSVALLFLLLFRPKDDLALLHPYIQSTYVHYFEQRAMPGVLWRTRELTLYGMPRRDAYSKATDILKQIYSRKAGWTYDPRSNSWRSRRGSVAFIFGKLDVNEWQGNAITPYPQDQMVPDDYPFYFKEESVRIDDWKEQFWARATGKIDVE